MSNPIVNRIPRMRLEAFAERHGLQIEVNERAHVPINSDSRFYATCRGLVVMGDHVLISTFGNGRTPFKAIRAYAKELSQKRLVIGAYTPKRKEIEPIVLT